MIKKGISIFFFAIFLSTLVLAQGEKIDIETVDDSYGPNENITVIVSLLDSGNNPINTEISVVFEDVEKRSYEERTVKTNTPVDVNLGQNSPSGYWTLTANYEGREITGSFLIKSEEVAEFKIEGNVLKITNRGNTRYEKTIQVIIGDSVGIKKPSLEIGEFATFRLVAPDGNYNIRVTDGTTSLTKGDVQLTGDVVGILDEGITRRSPITGVGPEDLGNSSYNFVKQNQFAYIFILAVVGAAILLGIERHYRRKVKGFG